MEPFDFNQFREVMMVLQESGATFFKNAQFSVGFQGPPQDDEEEEVISTTAVGFQALSDAEDEEAEEELKGMHARAFGAKPPRLNPVAKKA